MQYKYTEYYFRIKTLCSYAGPNWVFLPGGPGIGSEYLEDFCTRINIPGSKHLIDYPQDGTNMHGELSLRNWQNGLKNLAQQFRNPIFVAHSFAGMLVLSTPSLEKHLKGLVLMNTTPENNIFLHMIQMQIVHNLPNLLPLMAKCAAFPTALNYKKFWNAYKHYCFTVNERKGAELIMHNFNHNIASNNMARDNFYPHFQSKWSPKKIPALTIASSEDYICPPNAFSKNLGFQRPNITNKIISGAGHFPWINHFDEVDEGFVELSHIILNNKL